MKRKLLARRPSPAMVVAVVALVSSLSGVAVGAALITGDDIAKKSIGKKHLKKNAVVTKKVKNGTLLADDFKAGQLKEGVQGLQGLKGEKGDKGDPGDDGVDGADATALWAVVNGGDGTTYRASHVASSVKNGPGLGSYTVTFDQSVAGCAFIATIGGNDGVLPKAAIGTAKGATASAVNVAVFDAAGFQDGDFTLAVFC